MATDQKRTKGIHLYTPADGVARLDIEREVLRTYENGDRVQVRGSGKSVSRPLADIETNPLPGGEVTLRTYGDLLGLLLSACSDELESARDAEIAAYQKKADDAAKAHVARIAAEIAAKKSSTP